VGFDVAADAYDRFMGRYSGPLAAQMADFAHVRPGLHVVDVGCGPGALTGELVARVGADNVRAADPSQGFVAALAERHPGVDATVAPAEALAYEDDAFDLAVAQLVVHFMRDPVAGLREMARVTRAGGLVAACVWDHAGDRGPLTAFWQAVRELDPEAPDESGLAGAREGHLLELFAAAGLRDVEGDTLEVHVEHPSFESWWEPYTESVGPAGAYVAGRDDAARTKLRERCRAALGDGPFTVAAFAWAARGRA
jgi:SAM-dependent methyltransferase